MPYETRLVQISELGGDDIIIAFMGQSGSGKSQIIDALTGEPGQRTKVAETAEDLKSVTQGLEAIRILSHRRYGSRIVLVDTPGFNHSSKTDEEILQLIREWLDKTYKKRIQLSGIVCVYRIVDPISPTPRRIFVKCAKLTHPRSAKNVVLATTMWDTLGPSSDAQKREEGLQVEFRNIMIPHGTTVTVERFLNNSDSAWGIVDNVVKGIDEQGVISKKKHSFRIFRILGGRLLKKKSVKRLE